MNAAQLRPASELARKFGAKCIAYGPPGSAKTPLCSTAIRPVLCSVEPGLLSMQTSNVPTWEARTPAAIDEFFKWIASSTEAVNYDTVCIDSMSEIAELFVKQELARHSHGMQAYGEMATRVMKIVNALYYMPNKHIYMISKLGFRDESGVNTKVPGFPGKELNQKIPHLFDEILYFDKALVPSQGKECLCIRTSSTFGIHARDRSGKLAELERPHLGNLFNKCMS